jgi:hypothetical protein
VAGGLSALSTVLVIFGLEETLPSKRGAAGSSPAGTDNCNKHSSKAGYHSVPADDADVLGMAEARGKQELELGSLRRDDSSLGSGGTPPSSKAAAGGGKPGPFKGDSARIGAAWGPQSPSEQQQYDEEASLQMSRSPSVMAVAHSPGRSMPSVDDADDSSLEVDIVVYSAGDVEQGSWQRGAEQQQLLETTAPQAQPLGAAERPAGEPAVPAALLADLPWYRHPGIVRALLGYGLIAFVFNMLGELG